MALIPRRPKEYHVFLASPGDVNAERQHVRRFFEEYSRSTGHLWNARFQVIDWENCASIGVGRPQELITRQTLEKHKDSLALVVGIMGQRFGTPSGKADSGTEEEFNWALESHKANGFPEIKWFFRTTGKLEMPADPDEALKAVDQWRKVLAFRQRMDNPHDRVFYAEYPGADRFRDVFDRDLNLWLGDASRPWAAERAAEMGATRAVPLPVAFESERYREAVLKEFGKLKLDMLDTTGAYYTGVRLWSVFVPQSARECHQYNPRLLEIPKEHQKRLLECGEISADELADAERQAEQLRRDYFNQPLRPVLDVVDEDLQALPSRAGHRLVILGDPGSGKSSLIRYLALRWASIADQALRDAQRIPLVIDLGLYSRWRCEGQKGLIRFLEEASIWYGWPPGLLERLLSQLGRVVLLLDGLDEVFEPKSREEVVNDILRFTNEQPQTPIVVTSRVVGYQPQRLRDADFRAFMLQDLDAAQINAFIDRWHEETFDDEAQAAPKRERLKKAIHDSKSIALLAGNPLLLTMMAILNRHQELPRDRVDLYDQASRLLLHQWDTERALADFPGLSAEIGWREKSDMLRRVAFFLQAGPSGLKGNMIAGPKLASLIEDYLRTELHFEQSRAAARAVVDHLRQRNFILCFVGADSYGFVHRTFLEYFCAAEFVHQFNIAKTLNEAGLIALFHQHCRNDDWREVLRLICGQIDETFVAKIVSSLSYKTDVRNWDGESYLPELILAGFCLSETRVARTEEARKAGERLLHQFICALSQAHHPAFSVDLHRLLDDIVIVSRELGPRWPGHHAVDLSVVPKFKVKDGSGSGKAWAPFVGNIRPDREQTHRLSEYRYPVVRSGALAELAEKWPDEATRALLTDRALHDREGYVRGVALQSLAKKWPDDTTRVFLTGHARRAQDRVVRCVALQTLAENWPDDLTRTLLTDRARRDPYYHVRGLALLSLAEKWPDVTTRTLLTERAVEDSDENNRGCAACLLGKMHSDFGHRVFSRSLDGDYPYFDPHLPVTPEHLERCAETVGLPADQLKTTLAELSRILGWDVTIGARPNSPTQPPAQA